MQQTEQRLGRVLDELDSCGGMSDEDVRLWLCPPCPFTGLSSVA